MDLMITAENQVSRTKIPLSYKRNLPSWMKNAKNEPMRRSIVFSEYSEDGMVLDMPENSCANGHILRLSIKVTGLPPGALCDFDFDVTVTEVEALPEERQRVQVKLTLENPASWTQFQEIFARRQDEIDKFLHEAKG